MIKKISTGTRSESREQARILVRAQRPRVPRHFPSLCSALLWSLPSPPPRSRYPLPMKTYPPTPLSPREGGSRGLGLSSASATVRLRISATRPRQSDRVSLCPYLFNCTSLHESGGAIWSLASKRIFCCSAGDPLQRVLGIVDLPGGVSRPAFLLGSQHLRVLRIVPEVAGMVGAQHVLVRPEPRLDAPQSLPWSASLCR